MNATDKQLKKNIDQFLNETASLDPEALKSFAKSKKVYVTGSRPPYGMTKNLRSNS